MGTVEVVPGAGAASAARWWHARVRWDVRYRRGVITSDVVSVLAVVGASTWLHVRGGPGGAWPREVGWAMGPAVVVLVVVALGLCRAWDRSVLGSGSEEFTRVARAYASGAVALAFAGVALGADPVRPWVFAVLPVAAFVTVLGRYTLRRGLHRRRRRGTCMYDVLAVGSVAAVEDLVLRTRRVPFHGWTVAAACVAENGAGPDVEGVALVGGLEDAVDRARALGARIVAVVPAPDWTPQRLRRLAWELEETGAELVVDPGLMEIGGPRLHVTPVDGLPMLRLSAPRLSGVARMLKYGTDRLFAAVLLLVLSPVLLVVATLVAAGGGPVFYRQTRSGQNGRTFRMIKFRTMHEGADQVILEGNDGAGPLFKLRDDPRVTPVGAVLRRWSLDELPQLVNILAGSMSLVGPRPPLPREVESYGDEARRRLLVRPGLTGLWQVNGRSDLSWDDSVRLDLRYVENWSPMLDLVILWKTVWAVLRGTGAY
ncbi:sugar transferase [Actinomycetospora termitidis]|uniref:Sugar transferase n=1 Tax=Actinomycetospora termitidis TaxID=3053470 RepID=A0ABT7MEW8_9PSEU|nr:sugar transferase [Actinomycetospora sp. Odt1-22]MDL5158981.1 sugar transferase [Actinomycetospora sp. Odt1-22]